MKPVERLGAARTPDGTEVVLYRHDGAYLIRALRADPAGFDAILTARRGAVLDNFLTPGGPAASLRRLYDEARRLSASPNRDRSDMTERTSHTLPSTREALVAAIARDTPGADQRRLIKVLDALIAWSVARAARLAFRTDTKRSDVLAFELEGTRTVFWSAQVTRGAGPALELYPSAGASVGEDVREMVRQTLNTYSRHALGDGDRLRIGFGALKNDTARAAVLALMSQLLAMPSEARASAAGVAG